MQKNIIKTSFAKEDKRSIYVKKSYLSTISMDIYGKWDVLQRNLNTYCSEKNITLQDVVSVDMIEQALEQKDSVINTVKNKLSEAISVEKQISKIQDLCADKNVLAHKTIIKEFYEKMLLIQRSLNIFDLDNIENVFISEIIANKEKMHELNTIYNMVRKFCTKSPIKKDTYPLYFNKSSCLSSFDYDKFKDGTSISSILRKDGLYYLLILNPEYATKLPEKAKTNEQGYEQLVYKQLTGLNKMFPKVFLAKSNEELYSPSERILNIAKNKLYTKEAADRESCVEWISFCIESFKKNKDWMKNFNPSFRKPEEYASANEFYTELERSTIRMDFSESVDESYLRQAVSRGEIFLFQLYSKDFSPYHNGKDSIYTRLLKEMFSEENLHRINHTDETALKLASGGSQLTFRKASLPYKETHPANVPIANKNPLNQKKESTFDYPLCKDKRYMTDKYLLSLAVQIGFRNEEVYKYDLNRMVNESVLKQMPNILSVRAGERHLLYYIVTDPNGNILEQDSLNIIHSKNDKQEVRTDYKEILVKRENEIAEAKEKWDYSKDIKKIKEGYLSQAIYTIVKLREKYNAVIFVEDYSGPFVQGRMKNMKTIYQQFQKALLQKLSCYVPEDKSHNEAIQLAYPVSSLEELKGQSGIVYFVNPSYTANIDPTTGFVNQYYEFFKYESMKKAKETVSKIMDIQYNEKNHDFEITISEKDFGLSNLDKIWVLHTKGIRSIYKDKKYHEYDCTEKMRELFRTYRVSKLEDIRNAENLNKPFYEQLFEIIQVLLKMHYYSIDLEEEYCLSPVKNKDKICFDSRTRKVDGLVNSAAVKTYLMCKKGMRDLQCIDEETLLVKRDEKGKHKDMWLAYLQTSVC